MSSTVSEKQTVTPSQEIVASFANEFRESLLGLIQNGVKTLEVNLSKVQTVDSVGLGVFIAAHNTLSQDGGKLMVTGVSDDLMKLFQMLRLDRHFEVISSAKESEDG